MNNLFKSFYEKERLARKENDIEALKQIFIDMVKICESEEEIVSLIKVLSVRRGQHIEAIRFIIQYVYKENNSTNFMKLLLKEIIEGKIYLERERVEFTTELKNRYGDTKEALDIILEVPIETFTLVEESTKIKYQLEQLRLCLVTKDWIKASIIMKRIRQKYFEENNAIDEKHLFYKYKIEYCVGQELFYEASKNLFLFNEKDSIIFSTFYCLISTLKDTTRENKQKQLEILKNHKNNDDFLRKIIVMFNGNLLINKQQVSEELLNFFNLPQYKTNLKEAIDEHNYFIIEKYYSVINLETFCFLMDIDEVNLINKILYMVNNNYTSCKINQKKKIVVFDSKIFNDSVDDVMNKLINVGHMIHKERLKYNTK